MLNEWYGGLLNVLRGVWCPFRCRRIGMVAFEMSKEGMVAVQLLTEGNGGCKVA